MVSHLVMSKKSAEQKPSRKKLTAVPKAPAPESGDLQKLKMTAATIGYIHAHLLKSSFKPDDFQIAHGAFLWLEEMSRQTIAIINEHEPKIEGEGAEAITDFDAHLESQN